MVGDPIRLYPYPSNTLDLPGWAGRLYQQGISSKPPKEATTGGMHWRCPPGLACPSRETTRSQVVIASLGLRISLSFVDNRDAASRCSNSSSSSRAWRGWWSSWVENAGNMG